MTGMSPRQKTAYIFMSLVNKYPCILVKSAFSVKIVKIPRDPEGMVDM